jgi:hypothetical protein
MPKRVSARKIKTHAQYTYQQAADALDVSLQTVRLWRGTGLEVLDSQKPHLILGFALKDFLTKRANKPERRLARDQFLCMACNAPRRAYGGMADYLPYNPTRGRLEALCEVCQGPCGKFSSPRVCAQLAQILNIATRDRE